MKRIISTLVIALITFSFIFWYRKTADYKPLEKTLIVGTSADFPPFAFRDKNNTIVGFDIDVIKEIGKRLNLDVDIQDKPFNTLLPAIDHGQIHVIAAGMTPTPEREKRASFTKPYLTGNPLLIVTLPTAPTITSIEDLKGKDVIVNTGYTADGYISQIPTINVIRIASVADALTALEQGKGFAFVSARFSLMPYIQDNQERFNYFHLQETDEQSALAISKKLPPEFAQQVQNALNAMQADGTLDALKLKWKVA
jgi:arginine/lysine/histidine transporter system substrate-binding protein